MPSITTTPEWLRLADLRRARQDRRLDDIFRNDPQRPARLSAEAAGVFLDVSRQRIDDEILDALFALARRRDLSGALAALWRGENVNHTEARPALHMALRGEPGDGIGNEETERVVAEQRELMRRLVERVRSGDWSAPAGPRFEHVVHVGIGGSHLGPALAIDVLDAVQDDDGPEIHFVSTTDPCPLARLMRRLPRERTLLVLVSKSFTTAETTLNGETLIDWLAGDDSDRETVLREQVVGVSANANAMTKAGIPREHQLHMPEWAGGRYSLWSSVGLPVALRFGMAAFDEMLAGARAMDQHFRSAEPHQNLPLLLGLVGVWNINFFDANTHAVIPYSEALAQLPPYLQQLEMESNGKRVDRDGQAVAYRTAPIIWGGVGMNGQHAFFQQLHQGTSVGTLDFILVSGPDCGLPRQRDSIIANGLAQAEALMRGRSEALARDENEQETLLPYRVFPGNRPSSTIVLDELDARRLGALLAMYEHKVFVQSVIWNLNPFDQFGVELGKKIAKRIEPWLSGGKGDEVDPATQRLLERFERK